MQQTLEVTNHGVGPKVNDQALILVTFKAKEGMNTFHAYLSPEEAAKYPLLAEVEFTLVPKVANA